jgi:hypothetical protein
MRYQKNSAGNRIVVATPKETHALRPCICAALRRWHCPEGDIEDFAQEVEVITWQALVEKRVLGDRYARPRDALLSFMFQVAWNLWRNHSRLHSTRCEILHDEVPDMQGPEPDACLEARDVLHRISMREDVACLLFAAVAGERPAQYVGLPKSTFWARHKEVQRWARDVASGKPHVPDPPTPKHRKKRQRKK